jgi:YbgC/YbaW family acyl-CoA thioester hydrolase
MKQHIVERKIMWGDLDSLGIVFYPRYYEWMDASGHLFFEALGLTIGELWQSRGIIFGLVETSCRYFKPGRYYQRISIATRMHTLESKAVGLKHTISCVSDGALMVEGFEKRICLDASAPEHFRAVEIPSDIRKKLASAMSI